MSEQILEKPVVNDLPYETQRKERIGYYTFFTGQNIIYMFVTIFLSIYYTSVMGIPAGIVGIIFLVARFWDAINDPILSIVIERSRFSGGKFKPWINVIALGVPISTILVFSFGNQLAELPLWIRVSYALITYIAWGMLYTISDAPAYALGSVMTSNKPERNVIYSFVRFGGFAGMVAAMFFGPWLLEKLNNNWAYVTIILSAVAMVLMVPIRSAKERHVVEQPVPTLKDIFSTILGNRYLVIFITAFIFIGGTNFAFTLMPFIARDLYGDPSLTTVLLVGMIAPSMLAALSAPYLIRVFGKITMFTAATVGVLVTSLITWFAGYEHFNLFLMLTLVKAVFGGYILVIPSILIADCIEYGFTRTGKRIEAVAFAAQTFSNKAVGAVGGSVAMGYLAMVGFVESTGGQIVEQPETVLQGMWDVLNLGQAIGAVIGLAIFVWGYRLTEERLNEIKRRNQYT